MQHLAPFSKQGTAINTTIHLPARRFHKKSPVQLLSWMHSHSQPLAGKRKATKATLPGTGLSWSINPQSDKIRQKGFRKVLPSYPYRSRIPSSFWLRRENSFNTLEQVSAHSRFQMSLPALEPRGHAGLSLDDSPDIL